MANNTTQLQEDARFRILRLLQESPEMSQRELARSVGISAGSTHYILNSLVEKGFVKLGNFSVAKDKRRYAYILTRKGIAEKTRITKQFLARKLAEYDVLKTEIDGLLQEIEGEDKAKSFPTLKHGHELGH